jgi:TonB family protein
MGQEAPPGSLSSPVQRKDPAQFVEERPPVSRGELYAAPQLRYCLAESLRIEAVREVLDKSEPGSVEEFNAKIADFNGRCASYRFYESEMFFVKSEVEGHRARLQADARNDYLQRVAARRVERATAQAAAPAATPAEATPEVAKPVPTPAPSAPERTTTAEVAPPAEPQARQPAAAAPRPAPTASPGSTEGTSGLPAAPVLAEGQTPALPAETAGPAEAISPEPAGPAPVQTEERGASSKAPTQPDDAVMTRYVRDIQKAGTRTLDERQVPEAARAKAWSGAAQIEVRFSAGGFIRSIVLAQSSGRQEFDDHALATARGIMFPHVPKELVARDFTARFPIAFKPRKAR